MRRYEPIRRDALAAISRKITIECAGLQIPDRRLDPDTGGFPVGRQLCFKQRFIQAPQNDAWQAVAEDANRWPSQGVRCLARKISRSG